MNKHKESVVAALQRVKSAESEILECGMRLMKSADGDMYVFDWFAMATLNRAASMSSAFHTLVTDFNMVAAGALIRIHLDTALRYFASHLVVDYNAFAEAVVGGQRIDKMIDRNGKRLTDRHLFTEFEKRVPGTQSLYERACGYVHFSRVHTSNILDGRLDRVNCVAGIKIGARDRQLSDDYYIDACDSCTEITGLIIDLVQSWIDYKNNEHAIQAANAERATNLQ